MLKVIKEQPYNISKLSLYGLKNTPLDEPALPREQLFYIVFSQINVLRSLDPVSVADILSKLINE